MKEKMKEFLLHILKDIWIYLLVILITALIMSNCKHEVAETKTDNTQLFAKMKSDSLLIVELTKKRKQDSLKVIASKHKEDSLKRVSDKYTTLYKTSSKKLRQQISVGICDTVQVKEVVNNCDSVIYSKDKVIAQKDSTFNKITEELNTVKKENKTLTSENASGKEIIQNQEITEKETKIKLKNQKIKTFFVFVGAVAIEVLTILTLK